MKRLRALWYWLFLVSLLAALTACASPQATQQPTEKSQTSEKTAQNPSAEVPPEAEPEAIPAEALFVCQTTTNQVAVIDLASGEIVKEIPVGARPMTMLKSPDNCYLYVANSGSGDVYMINALSGEIEAKMSMGNQPVALAINQKGDTLYALDYYLNRVGILDLNLRTLVGFYALNTFGFEERIEPPDCCSDIFGEPLGAGRKPSALFLNEAEQEIYVGNMGTWDVAIIDLVEEKEVAAFDATFGINRIFMAGKDNLLYISAAGNNLEVNDFILAMDLKAQGKLQKFRIGVKPVSMALAPDGRTIYVVTQDDTRLTGVDVQTGQIINHCLLEGEPGDVVLSEDGSKAFVADLLEGTVFVVDTQNYSVLKRIEAGVTPKSLVYIKN